MGNYHSVYVVAQDVYGFAGASVLDELAPKNHEGKNLLVVPHEITARLQEMVERGLRGVGGAQEVLGEFAKLGPHIVPDKPRQRKKEPIERGEPVRFSDGLDVKFLNCHQSARDFSIPELAATVRTEYGEGTGENPNPIVLTKNTHDLLYFRDRGINAQTPRFLVIDADIVQEGIIDGNEELQAALDQQQGTIPQDDAERILNRTQGVYPHQFIQFGEGRNARFARVGGKVQGDPDRIHGLERVVKLLEHTEYGKQLRIGETRHSSILGIEPLDMRQYIAMQYAILNPDVRIAFITGESGTGKTLLAYACAIAESLIY